MIILDTRELIDEIDLYIVKFYIYTYIYYINYCKNFHSRFSVFVIQDLMG